MFDAIAAFLKVQFGELAAIKIGLWVSLILALATIYGFFFKETANAYEKYYAYKLEKCADAVLTTARIANLRDDADEELRSALTRFDELYYGHLILFEGRNLASEMVRFRALFVEKDQALELPKVKERRQNGSVEVRQAALRLAAQCRKEVRPTMFDLIYDRIFPVRQ